MDSFSNTRGDKTVREAIAGTRAMRALTSSLLVGSMIWVATLSVVLS